MAEPEVEKIYEPAEMYGKIMQFLHFKDEEKNLQYISNQIFKAACQDLQLHNKNGWKKNTAGSKTKYLDQYLKTLATAIVSNPENNNKSIKPDELVVTMKQEISRPYEELKQNLNDVRVLGVGKGIYEKAAASLGIVTRGVIAPAISLGIVTLGALVIVTGIVLQIKGIKGAIQGSSSLVKSAMDIYVGRSIENLGSLGVKAGALAGVVGSYKSFEMHDIRGQIKNVFRDETSNSISNEVKGTIKTKVFRDKVQGQNSRS